MTIMMRFHRHAEVDGKPGAWFKGYEYRAQRSCLKKFWTYGTIIKSFQNCPEVAEKPLGRWTLHEGEQEKRIAVCSILTEQFRAALAKGFEVACRETHRQALRGKHNSFCFNSIEIDPVNHEMIATFIHDGKRLKLPEKQIHSIIDKYPAAINNPEKPEFYTATVFNHGRLILPGAEISRALALLSKHTEKQGLELQPS